MSHRIFGLLSILLLYPACASGWQSLTVENVPYDDLFRLTAHVIDSEGFVLDEMNPHKGTITTCWDYNKLVDVGRFPIRRKAEARIDPEGEDAYEVKLEIVQEALWESYRVENPSAQDGWESYDYDKETTRGILTRIRLMVEEFKPSDRFYDKYKRRDEIREKIPEVLEGKGDG